MESLARNIGAAVLGWVTMAVGVFILMSLMWLGVGAEGAFRPGSWDVSTSWSLGSIAVGLLAALVGGLVCAKTSTSPWAVRLLVVIVVALGVMVAVGEMSAPVADAGPRPDGVGMIEAIATAQQPRWLTWLNPVLGAVGAILGTRMIRRSPDA